MPFISIVFGGLLIALGAWGYSTSELEGARKMTALIPAGFGAVLIVCGLLALKASLLKHAMHAAATVGLVGFLLAGGRFAMGAKDGIDFAKPATRATGMMAFICLVFVGFCVNSFIQARRRRAKAAEKAAGPAA